MSTVAGAGATRPRLRPLRVAARILGYLAMLACWLLVLVLGALTWGPQATKYRTDIIVGQSMEPTIPLYSVIIVEPVEPRDIRRGDVITYQQPGMPERKVTHRVQRVERGERGGVAFVTKGDNNDVRDPYRVAYAEEGYRVVAHAPRVGWLLIHAQTKWARLLLVVAPVLLLLVQFLRWVWRAQDEPDEARGVERVEGRDDRTRTAA